MHPIETPDKTFHDGDGVSELGTILPAWWLNQVQSELLAVLTEAGIRPDKAKPNQVVEALRKIIDEQAGGKGLPVGAVIGFPRAITSQEGFLKADGSTFAQATYPDLYRVLGGNKLPNLTRSDVGMTAYFPSGDIPDGWIKYDEIATRVTQAAYPDLYRKLVAQYGSIDAVPKAESIAMVLCIKAQNSLDDVVMWIKAYGKVTNAGVLDASTLAAQLQNKSDKGHTHRAAEITDLSDTIEAVVGRLFASEQSALGYLKIPGGLIIQWGSVNVRGDGYVPVVFPIAFPNTYLNVQVSVVYHGVVGGASVLSAHVGNINNTGCHIGLSENGISLKNPVYWVAIGF
ncbi:gp53-like domain-containing protein [Neisseria subflava]|uniref:gp53-like domain-containing protein n=1 Tax=Neisseria subflava TaxID=28449 RepID=UPI0024B275DB|nr:tail fiber protein [Neisseria subflava]